MKRKFTKLAAALALLAFLIPPAAGWGQMKGSISWTASEQGYSNGQEITSVDFDNNVSASFDKGTNSNAPKYYTSGSAIRCYGGNTITITSSSDNLTGITIAFGESDGSNEITTNVTSYSDGTWTGDAASVTFTIGGTTGNRRIAGFTITYGGVPTPTVATPIFSPAAGTYTEAQTVEISCTTEGATIYYTIDGEAPTTESNVYRTALTINETTTVKAMAVKEGMNNSAVATAVYTIEAPAVEQTFSKISGHNPVAGQTYLIVDLNSNKALTSANGTNSAPTAVSVTINNNQITTSESALQWTFEAEEGGYVIHPVGDNAKWLYSTNSNDGVRVGTNTNKVWELDITDETNYHGFKNVATSRYIGVYNNQNWRTYTTIHNNIKDTQIALFVLGEAPNDPVISASNVSIDYDATEGEIEYTIENSVAGAIVVATPTAEWLTIGTVGETVPFTCSANTETSARTATVTLNYMNGEEVLATKDVTVTQGAAPMIYTTIPALFAAATSTATDVTITFGGWVISAVNNSNAYLTDNQGHGLIIYASNHSFQVNDVLTGTASCKLQTYRGSAELTNLTSSTEGLTVENSGTVTEQSIAISSLGGVNTGALLAYQGLTYNGSALVDNENNTITPYTTLYSGTFDQGKVYNVKGIYLQYNSTKEILPRSAEDIVEVVSTEPAINATTPETLAYNATQGSISYTIDNPIEGQSLTATTETEWISNITVGETTVTFTCTANEGTEDRTATITLSYEGAESVTVTITQGHYSGPGNWVLTSLADLTPGDVFVIVGNKGSNYALPNDGGTSSAPSAVSVTIAENTLSGEIAENLQWNLSVSNSGYTFYPADSVTTWLYCTNSNNGVRVGTGDAKHFTLSENGYLTTTETTQQRYIGIYNSQDWRCYTSQGGNIADQTFAFYKKVSDDVTYRKDISAYEGDGGYMLIASPVCSVVPSAENGFLTSEYDLYYFDQTGDSEGKEWINYEAGAFNLTSGKGYLYASSTNTTLTFTGQPYNGNGVVALDYDAEATLAGWNLIGNPYAEAATCNKAFYRLNSAGSEVNAETESGSVAEMEGVFVVAEAAGETVTFTKGNSANTNATLALNVTQNRGNLIDRAIVRFDEGQQLPKFQLNPNNTKIYVAQGNKDYAIVRSAAEGEMPVSFKANENGTYTLSVEAENVEMNYLHLIDNMTGADVDLLATPSYSFEARTSDYTSRFRLVFSASQVPEPVEGPSAFAFFNGSSWTVSNMGEATLQVVDMMGRVLSSQTLNGNADLNVNQPAGVYMLRLVNGNDVKVQKVVVE